MTRIDVSHIKGLVDSAKSITILLSQNPTYDAVAASLACKLALDSANKVVNIVCDTPMTVEYNRLIGVDSVRSAFGSKNLVISFSDLTDHVDKVSYNMENGELQLLVTPKPGAPDLDHRLLKFIPGRGASDLIITIDTHQLSDLGKVHSAAKDALTSAKVISITNGIPKENYTAHQVYNSGASSLSELMAYIIEELHLEFDEDVATNLLAGIEAATNNFQSDKAGHATFEVASILLKKGAIRQKSIKSQDFPTGSIPKSDFLEDMVPPAAKPVKQPATTSASDWNEPKIFHAPMLQ